MAVVGAHEWPEAPRLPREPDRSGKTFPTGDYRCWIGTSGGAWMGTIAGCWEAGWSEVG